MTLRVFTIPLRITALETAVLVELAPESPKGVSIMLPLDTLLRDVPEDAHGEEWKRGDAGHA